jgi:hypothetical protein
MQPFRPWRCQRVTTHRFPPPTRHERPSRLSLSSRFAHLNDSLFISFGVFSGVSEEQEKWVLIGLFLMVIPSGAHTQAVVDCSRRFIASTCEWCLDGDDCTSSHAGPCQTITLFLPPPPPPPDTYRADTAVIAALGGKSNDAGYPIQFCATEAPRSLLSSSLGISPCKPKEIGRRLDRSWCCAKGGGILPSVPQLAPCHNDLRHLLGDIRR